MRTEDFLFAFDSFKEAGEKSSGGLVCEISHLCI